MSSHEDWDGWDNYKILDKMETLPHSESLRQEIEKIKTFGIPTVKDNKESEKFRLEGNNYFKQKKHYQALEEYNQSLAYAENNSLEQKLVYANRSALLFRKGYYKECLQDIDRALKGHYPENKKAQLIERKENAEKLLPSQEKVPFHDEIPEISQKNSMVPAASDAIKIARNEKYGRLFKATRDIKIGEILIVEEPYVFITERNYRWKHCYECGELCFNMIPCDDCLTMYCSEECRNSALELYHRYECVVERYFGLYPITTHKIGSMTNINAMYSDVKLPVKMTIRALNDIYYQKHEGSPKGYHTHCYEEVKKLKTHKEDVMRDIMKMIGLTGQLIKIFYLLTIYTDIKMEFRVPDNAIKNLLFHNMLVKLGNTFASFARKKTDADEEEALHRTFNNKIEITLTTEEIDQQHFGTGIYPVCSLLNHSCHPETEFFFYGKTLVVRAKRDIEKGKQCFTGYVPAYYVEDRTTRREQLYTSPFFFTCYCKACKEDWPLILSNCCPVYKHVEFKYGPSVHTWKYNKEHYKALKEYYKLFFMNNLPEEDYPKYWPKIQALYQKIKHEEPSPSFGLLDSILDKVFFSYNRIVKF